MSEVMRHLRERSERYKARGSFRPMVSVALSQGIATAASDPTMDTIYLDLVISTSFTYRPNHHAEFERGRRMAEETLTRFLYEDVLGDIQRVVHAIHDHDRDSALEYALALKAKLEGR